MPESTLYEFCIYTIVHRDTLAKAASKDRASTFTEVKRWMTGAELFRRAEAIDTDLPIVFADAADCSKLIYWGIVTNIIFADSDSTKFTVKNIRAIRGKHAPQDLVLRSSGNHIAERFIRPYALCHTPRFLR